MVEFVRNAMLNELEEMKRRMDSLYAESFEAPASDEHGTDRTEQEWEPAMDVLETEDSFRLFADLPGVKDRDLQVEVAEGRLLIRGRRESVPAGTDSSRLALCERMGGFFTRTFMLPADCETDSAKAVLQAGVLSVEIPRGRVRADSARKISVRAE